MVKIFYAKIIDGVFIPAPRKIEREIDGEIYITYNPTDEMFAEQDWLLVVEMPIPSDVLKGYHYEVTYSEQNDKIIQSWELVEDPETSDEISDAEALAIILGGAV